MYALKIGKQGNSAGVTFNKEMLAHLHASIGDTVFVTDAPGGGYRVTPFDPNFEHQMTVATNIMKRRRNALRELAKR
jgi:putative addiction module antidote